METSSIPSMDIKITKNKKLGIGPCTCNPNAMDMETGKSSLLVT